MEFVLSHPLVAGPLFIAFLFFGSVCGAMLRHRAPAWTEHVGKSVSSLENAVLGMLALLLGFTFAMAVSRYDMHIALEVQEASSLETLWMRAGTLPQPERAQEQALIQDFLKVRMRFAEASTDADALQNLKDTAVTQQKMWAVAEEHALENRDPVTALFLTAMTDAADAAEKRAAALDNRIPTLAWVMLLFVSFMGCLLVGMSIPKRAALLMWVVPVTVGVVLALVIDLDSPHGGFVAVDQQSMVRVAAEINAGPGQ